MKLWKNKQGQSGLSPQQTNIIMLLEIWLLFVFPSQDSFLYHLFLLVCTFGCWLGDLAILSITTSYDFIPVYWYVSVYGSSPASWSCDPNLQFLMYESQKSLDRIQNAKKHLMLAFFIYRMMHCQQCLQRLDTRKPTPGMYWSFYNPYWNILLTFVSC